MQTIETQREGYLALAAISLSETRRNEFESFISSVDDYNGHDDYYTTLNFVMNWLNEQGIAWTCALDWKSEISLLRSKIEQQLAGNFAAEVDLPDPASFGAYASVSKPLVFVAFDEALREFDFQFGFIDTESDEYVLFVHRVEDAAAAREAVEKIGYRYMDRESPNVRNEPPID